MDIAQILFDNMSSQYHKLFFDWEAAAHEQALIPGKLFSDSIFDKTARILTAYVGLNHI